MIAPQTFNNFPEFGSQAIKCKPGDSKYSNGFIPGEVFPAEYVNWFFSGATVGVTGAQAGLSSIERELQTLLACAGKSPNVNCFSQVYDSVQYLIQSNLGNAAACPLGTASAGQSTYAARADHVHPVPNYVATAGHASSSQFIETFDIHGVCDNTKLHWISLDDTPTYLWGANNQKDTYLWSPSSLEVGHSNSTEYLETFDYQGCVKNTKFCWFGNEGTPTHIWGTNGNQEIACIWYPSCFHVACADKIKIQTTGAIDYLNLLMTGPNSFYEGLIGVTHNVQFNQSTGDLKAVSFTGNLNGRACTAGHSNSTEYLETFDYQGCAKNTKFCWYSLSGTPAYVWGGCNQEQSILWNPAEFCVCCATNATHATHATNATYATSAISATKSCYSNIYNLTSTQTCFVYYYLNSDGFYHICGDSPFLLLSEDSGEIKFLTQGDYNMAVVDVSCINKLRYLLLDYAN